MPDEALTGIDDAITRGTRRRHRPRVTVRRIVAPTPVERDTGPVSAVSEETERDSQLITVFLVLQFLSGIALFVPGAQVLRGYVRALPYLASLLPLGYYLGRPDRTRMASAGFLVSALLLLTLNLLHPTTQLTAGIGQCVFQLAIVAPMFWAAKVVRSPRQLERILVITFLFNLAGAVMGLLQVYDPDRFLPAQFSQQLNEDYLSSLSYLGAGDRLITRPPGLSDVPGGAAVSGGLAALLGLCLTFRTRRSMLAPAFLAASAVGLAVIYLTQARSTLLMTIGAAVALTTVTIRRGHFKRATWLIGAGAALVIVSFLWASSLGGSAVDARFLDLRERGALSVYQENRGNFLAYTVGEMLDKYPLGAGVGRWGMMNAYLGDPRAFGAEPIHVEIQLTGWLLDGGVLMWLLYGSAILSAMYAVFRITAAHRADLADAATSVLAVGVFVVGMSFSGPAFNTQLGVLFWFLIAATRGASIEPEPHDAAIEGSDPT